MSLRRVADLDDLEFYPRNLTHSQILERLNSFCPADVETLRVMAEIRLRQWWAQTYQVQRPH